MKNVEFPFESCISKKSLWWIAEGTVLRSGVIEYCSTSNRSNIHNAESLIQLYNEYVLSCFNCLFKYGNFYQTYLILTVKNLSIYIYIRRTGFQVNLNGEFPHNVILFSSYNMINLYHDDITFPHLQLTKYNNTSQNTQECNSIWHRPRIFGVVSV